MKIFICFFFLLAACSTPRVKVKASVHTKNFKKKDCDGGTHIDFGECLSVCKAFSGERFLCKKECVRRRHKGVRSCVKRVDGLWKAYAM